jgi:glycosyltransferase involved in cell wall biosynthesis
MIGARPHDFVIACPSRFTPRKGQLDLLDAIDTLHPRLRHRVVTVLAGSANSGSREFEDRLRDRATNMDARVVVQRVDRSRMPDLLAGADVVALPSHFEGLGFAAIEAMVACRAVLMTKVCGFDEVISNESEALLVPPRDPVALGAAIEQLLVDEPRRERLARAGHQRALSVFTASRFLEGVVCVYEECLQNAGTPARVNLTNR